MTLFAATQRAGCKSTVWQGTLSAPARFYNGSDAQTARQARRGAARINCPPDTCQAPPAKLECGGKFSGRHGLRTCALACVGCTMARALLALAALLAATACARPLSGAIFTTTPLGE